eukprot:1508928-Ditylum_brightwellii.AAC.1
MFGGNAESHSTECCNKKALLASLLDGHKRKHTDKAKKEKFCTMAKPSRRPTPRATNLARGLLLTHWNQNLPWMRSDIRLN